MDKEKRNSILKYPGGKTRELKKLKKLFPKKANRFIDPFVGGGSVWLGSDYNEYMINDYSKDLINLYNSIKYQKNKLNNLLSTFDDDLSKISFNDKVLNSLYGCEDIDELGKIVTTFASKINIHFYKSMDIFKNEFPKYLKRKLGYLKKKGILSKEDNISLLQTSLNGAYYNSIRYIYNNDDIINNLDDYDVIRASVYLYIREFCYSSMFRFSKTGKFNVPYGGKSYNNKRFYSHIDYYSSDYLNDKFRKTDVYNLDFEDFMNGLNLSKTDFIFLDPPYDTDFSTYDNNAFDKNEQKRLSEFIKKQDARWLLVIKDSELIRSLYPASKYNYLDYKNRYSVNFKNRNLQKVKHLVITNYSTGLE